MELAEDELHVEERQRAQHQHQQVGDEKGAAAVFVAEVREPPDVGEIHGEPDDAEQEVDVAAPGLSLRILPCTPQCWTTTHLGKDWCLKRGEPTGTACPPWEAAS